MTTHTERAVASPCCLMSAIGPRLPSPNTLGHRRYLRVSSVEGDRARRLKMTQCMVRPCVARGFRRSVGFQGLASMYPASHWSVCAPGHHGYQRASVLISRQASNGPFGSPGLAGAGKTGPPSRFILSQTSAGKRTNSSIPPSMAQFLCSCREAVPSSRPAGYAGHRAQGLSRLAVAIAFVLAPASWRPRLDGPEHGATLTQVGAKVQSS
jgi:hypothetical protein